jgi:hypothetical protein
MQVNLHPGTQILPLLRLIQTPHKSINEAIESLLLSRDRHNKNPT